MNDFNAELDKQFNEALSHLELLNDGFQQSGFLSKPITKLKPKVPPKPIKSDAVIRSSDFDQLLSQLSQINTENLSDIDDISNDKLSFNLPYNNVKPEDNSEKKQMENHIVDECNVNVCSPVLTVCAIETLNSDLALSALALSSTNFSHSSLLTQQSSNSSQKFLPVDNSLSSSEPSPITSGINFAAGDFSVVDEHDSAFCDSVSNSSRDRCMNTSTKAEQFRNAIEKMKQASIKKTYVRIFLENEGSLCLSRSVLIDERWTASDVIKMLSASAHDCALVEQLPELYMERFYEDNELVLENLLLWTPDSPNKLILANRPDKYRLFEVPHEFLLPLQHAGDSFANINKQQLIEEFFVTDRLAPPELCDFLWIKQLNTKTWKRHQCVLRASGLYYVAKPGKSTSSHDLTRLQSLDMACCYYGIGWKKKYKAPSEFCFALKHPQIQVSGCKYIRFFCCETEGVLSRWVAGIRIAKLGRQLLANFESSKAIENIDNTLLNENFCINTTFDQNSQKSDFDSAFLTDFTSTATIKRMPVTGSCSASSHGESEPSFNKSGTSGVLDLHVDDDLPPPPVELLNIESNTLSIATLSPADYIISSSRSLPPPTVHSVNGTIDFQQSFPKPNTTDNRNAVVAEDSSKLLPISDFKKQLELKIHSPATCPPILPKKKLPPPPPPRSQATRLSIAETPTEETLNRNFEFIAATNSDRPTTPLQSEYSDSPPRVPAKPSRLMLNEIENAMQKRGLMKTNCNDV